MAWELKPEKYMSREEVQTLRRVCDDRAAADQAKGRVSGVRAWAVIDLVSSTGLRVGEVAALRIGDLHLSGKQPYLWVVGGKARKATDREQVSVSKALAKHLREFIKHKRDLGEDVDSNSHLFISKRGAPYTTRALQKMFKDAAKRAGLPAYHSIHSLRHSWGTYLYQKTKNLRLVQKELRHRSPQTTAVYADVTPEERAEAVNGVWEEET
jgi:site-specific recombinase XerD